MTIPVSHTLHRYQYTNIIERKYIYGSIRQLVKYYTKFSLKQTTLNQLIKQLVQGYQFNLSIQNISGTLLLKDLIGLCEDMNLFYDKLQYIYESV